MTELERQLTAALETSSGQFATAQQQHSEQVATLRRQVEYYAGQVTRLTADYRALAEMLRGPWS